MFSRFVWIVLFVLIYCVDFSLQKIKNYVKMYNTATLNYEIIGYTIMCEPDCDSYCDVKVCDIAMYAKLCSVRPTMDFQKIMEGFSDIEDQINHVESSRCGSFDQFKSFRQMDNEPGLECGGVLHYLMKNGSFNFQGVIINGSVTVKYWTGNVLILAILATSSGGCVKSTLLWNFDLISLPSYSYFSRKKPIKVNLQTVLHSSEDKIIFRDSVNQIFISNVIPGSNYSESNNYSATLMAMRVEARCPQYYYLSGCWHYCNNVTNKHVCNIDNGNEQCLPGWLKSEVLYFNEDKTRFTDLRSVMVYKCNIIDSCYRSNCTNACFSTGNGTFACLSQALQFIPERLILLPGESVRCLFETDETLEDDTISFSWVYVQTNPNTASSNMIMKGDTLFVLDIAFPGYNNIVKCVATDVSGVTKVEETRNYTISLIPKFLRLNISYQQVYLGDYMKCYSNGWPEDYFFYRMQILTNNFDNEENSSITFIPFHARLGQMIINCSVGFNSANDTVLIYRSFIVYIAVFRSFMWLNNRKTIYFNNDSVEIVVNSSIPYLLEIIQLGGPSQAVIFPNRIQFSAFCVGGHYSFVAVLSCGHQTHYISFYRFLDASLFRAPTSVKLSNIKGYPSEVIYCIGNGYPNDFVDINLTLYSLSSRYVFTTDSNQLKVPSNATYNSKFEIECLYNMTVLKHVYSVSVSQYFTIRSRIEPFQIIYLTKLGLAGMSALYLFYLYEQLILTISVICLVCLYMHGGRFFYYFKTFLLYNKYRKCIRYHEKMTQMSNILLSMTKKSDPNQDLKLKLFYNFLQRKHRCSYTPGFAEPPEVKGHKKKPLIKNPSESDAFPPQIPETDFKNFYGVGPSAGTKRRKVFE